MAIRAGCQDVRALCVRFALGIRIRGTGENRGQPALLTANLFFGLSATDPLTFMAVVLLLTLVALAASYIPVRRAMRVAPMVALRHE